MLPLESSLNLIVVLLSILVVRRIFANMAVIPADSVTVDGDNSNSITGKSLSLSITMHSPSACLSATALKATLVSGSNSSLSTAVTSMVAEFSPAGIVIFEGKLKRLGYSAIKLTARGCANVSCVVTVNWKVSPSVISLFDTERVSCDIHHLQQPRLMTQPHIRFLKPE